MIEKLDPDERARALADLANSGWTALDERDAIYKSFKFKNFTEAFGWMTKAAIWAEKLNHHPEWSNVYNRVGVTLITHDCNGLSALDVKLAGKLDSLV